MLVAWVCTHLRAYSEVYKNSSYQHDIRQFCNSFKYTWVINLQNANFENCAIKKVLRSSQQNYLIMQYHHQMKQKYLGNNDKML